MKEACMAMCVLPEELLSFPLIKFCDDVFNSPLDTWNDY